MIRNHQISKEKAGFVTYSFLKVLLDQIELNLYISTNNLACERKCQKNKAKKKTPKRPICMEDEN